MSDRVPCVVPHCRRTKKRGQFSEWICSEHWRLVPPFLRRAKFASERAWLGLIESGSDDLVKLTRAHEAKTGAWNKCKSAAIERAGGLT